MSERGARDLHDGCITRCLPCRQFQTLQSRGRKVMDGNHESRRVNLQQTPYSCRNLLHQRCLGEPSVNGSHLEIKNPKPTLSARSVAPAEDICSVFTRAELSSADDQVSFPARSCTKPRQQGRHSFDVVDAVGVENCVGALGMHLRPLCDIPPGENAPPLIVTDLHHMFVHHGCL